jgi:hypothetical protein
VVPATRDQAEPLAPTRIERHGPALFAVIGVGMIAVAAVGYLADAVSTAFAVVGAGLLVVGGLAGRLLTFKLTATGIEGTLAARQVLVVAQEQAERQGDSEEAASLRRAREALDEWFLSYLASPESQSESPWVRAAALAREWRSWRPREGRSEGPGTPG